MMCLDHIHMMQQVMSHKFKFDTCTKNETYATSPHTKEEINIILLITNRPAVNQPLCYSEAWNEKSSKGHKTYNVEKYRVKWVF